MTKVDYSTRDQDVDTVLYIPIKKRKEIDLDTFYSYWKNIHGPVSARLPGQFQYWQYHFTHNNAIWPSIDGIEYEVPEEDQFDGVAELTFLSTKDCQMWIKAACNSNFK
ncbi:hypothetical protein AMR41_07890 [Hapalosiphon sp. MRB220]|nr:hypothetical protein AMR41_07890 [Hapalosiphon sp. MRB220]